MSQGNPLYSFVYRLLPLYLSWLNIFTQMHNLLVDLWVRSSLTFSKIAHMFIFFSFFLIALLKHLIKYLQHNHTYHLFKQEHKSNVDNACVIKAVVRYWASEQTMICFSEIPAQNLLKHTGTFDISSEQSVSTTLWYFSRGHFVHSSHSTEDLLTDSSLKLWKVHLLKSRGECLKLGVSVLEWNLKPG